MHEGFGRMSGGTGDCLRVDLGSCGVDFLSQARKVLSQRSPFDVGEDGSVPSTVPTLPSRLGGVLRQSESRKKQKRGGDRGKGSDVWVVTEEYFKDLALPDIDTLSELCSGSELVKSKCFLIPNIGNELVEVAVRGESRNGVVGEEQVEGEGSWRGVKSEHGEMADVKLGEAKLTEESGGSASSVLDSGSGLEWILGCRNRVFLNSERPSKKRKLLGSDAGLEKVLVPCPCLGEHSLCDFCSKDDTGKESNRLITCSSCKVTVHQRCYGEREASDSSWLCSWCGQKKCKNNLENPCLLCPRQGGALKPVHKAVETDGPKEFAHLFCSLWMPELYVEDIAKMEPVMNVEGISDARKKIICNICKVKCGTCLRCSYGSCRSSFHPICAREARNRMEIWGKYGFDNVELRAFCSKHSPVQDSGELHSGDLSQDVVVKGPVLSDPLISTGLISDVDDAHKTVLLEKPEKASSGNGCAMGSFNILPILKKLVDRGKVNVEDVASDIGMAPDSLAAALAQDGTMVPELQSKLSQWFKNHAYMAVFERSLKVNTKSEDCAVKVPNGLTVLGSDAPDVKSVPPRRRTKSSVRVGKNEFSGENSVGPDETNVNPLVSDGCLNKTSFLNCSGGNVTEDEGLHDSSLYHTPKSQGNSAKAPNYCISDAPLHEVCSPEKHKVMDQGVGSVGSTAITGVPELMEVGADSGFYMHPYILKFWEMQCSKDRCSLETPSNAGFCCDNQNQHSLRTDKPDIDEASELEQQLLKAREIGVLGLSPVDEVEGEIIYYQQTLLSNAVARKQLTENLVSEVAKSLPHEIDTARRQRWDAVLVNQYLCELREAKKRGRRERRHKEAQAVLAAATAALAASSRASAFRKEAVEESANQEPWAKETLSRAAAPSNSLEGHSDHVQSRSCDICNRTGMISKLLVCLSCKVSVHLDCYRSVKASNGPWYCDLCEELSLNGASGTSPISFNGRSAAVECGLCGRSSGAFRKATDGQWVHAFCAEWALESTFRRGQINSIEGIEMVPKGVYDCCICQKKQGFCIKCNYGNCQTAFHPLCARNAGYIMSIKAGGEALLHKAYCEKHGLEQRAKAQNHRDGIEELRNTRKVRVELEKLRLLCERIVKREKTKREIVIFSNEILAARRDCVAYSLRMNRRPSFHPDASSESATTSLKGVSDGPRFCNEELQKSDEIISVDSAALVKRQTDVHLHMDTEQKTDDSSTSQNPPTPMPSDKLLFSGKQIPRRQPNIPDSRERRVISRKHSETLEKELIMTSDQASVKNQRLPKGFIYVPVDSLPKEK